MGDLLPPLTTDLEEAKANLAEYGFARVADALSPEELAEAKARIESQAAGERDCDHAFLDGSGRTPQSRESIGRDGPNQRIWNLINKGEIFRSIVMKDLTQTLMKHVLGDERLGNDVLLSSFTANIAGTGGVPMALHSDQGYMPLGTAYPVVANVMWMLTDFTEENGATRIVPGSHREDTPTEPVDPARSIAAVGPAGTAMVFDGRLWHGTGANTTDESRVGILSYFCRPFLRQQENFTLSLAPEVIAKCSPELLSILGFQTWATLGMVEGSVHGTISPRPDEFVTELTG